MTSTFRLAECLPEHASFASDMRPYLKWLNNSLICTMLMVLLLKTCWILIVQIVSTWVSSHGQLMHYRCSNHSAISWQVKIWRPFTTFSQSHGDQQWPDALCGWKKYSCTCMTVLYTFSAGKHPLSFICFRRKIKSSVFLKIKKQTSYFTWSGLAESQLLEPHFVKFDTYEVIYWATPSGIWYAKS